MREAKSKYEAVSTADMTRALAREVMQQADVTMKMARQSLQALAEYWWSRQQTKVVSERNVSRSKKLTRRSRS